MRRYICSGLLTSLALLAAAAILGLWALHHWLAERHLRLTVVEGVSVSRQGISLARLVLNQRRCRQLTVEDLLLGYREAEWRLAASRLHWTDSCPTAPESQPGVPAAVPLPHWLPAVTLEIEQLQLGDLPVIAAVGGYQPGQRSWQLQLRQGESYRLSLSGSAAAYQCRLEGNAPGLQLTLQGRCHPQSGLALTGQVELARSPVPLNLEGDGTELVLKWGPFTASQGTLQGGARLKLRQRLLQLQAHWQLPTSQWRLSSETQVDPQGLLSGSLQLEQNAARRAGSHLQAQWTGSIGEPELRISPGSQLLLALPGVAQLRLQPTTPWVLGYRQQQLMLTGSGRWQAPIAGIAAAADGQVSARIGLQPADQSLTGELEISGQHQLDGAGQLQLATTLTLAGNLSQPQLQIPAGSRLILTRPHWQQWQAERLLLTLLRTASLGQAGLFGPLQLQLDSERPSWQGRPLPALSSRLSLSPADGVWRLSGTLESSGGKIGLAARLSQSKADIQVTASELPLAPLLTPLMPEGELTGGQLSARGQLNWHRDRGLYWRAEGRLTDVSAVHPQGLVAGVDLGFDATGNDSRLTVAGRVAADEANPGIALRHLRGSYHWSYSASGSQLLLGNVNAKVFDGTLSARSLKYPSAKLPDELTLERVSLEEIVKLQQHSVVALGGRVDAVLPLRLTPAGIEIHAGRITNSGPLQMALIPTPAVERWLGSQPQLAQVGDYLRQLRIDTLSAQVDLASNGDMVLNSRLLGLNPSKGPRQVQLNYRHEENLLDLLTTLRMSDRFSREIEQHLQRQPERSPLKSKGRMN